MAEEQLLAECRSGEPVVLGDGTRPDYASPERTIRADLLRYLILGGCEAFRTHERGVQVKGAWIDGNLDLAFATARGATVLRNCGFPDGIEADQAALQRLDLEGSRLKGLSANGCQVTGDVWLDGVETSASVLLAGATIGGQLACEGAKLVGGDGKALNAQGSRITSDVFLSGLTSKGEVSFSGARIGGQLGCDVATLDGGGGMALNAQGAQIADDVFLNGLTSKGEVSFCGARIGGQLSCEGAKLVGRGGKALNAQRLRVERGFFWRGVGSVTGAVDLVSAHVSDLVDDLESWEKVDSLRLVGLTYDNLHGPLDEEMRLAWLRKGAKPNGVFHPQPYQQLAKVLRGSGHRAEAQAVLIAMERERRRAARSWRRREIHYRRDVRRLSRERSQTALEVIEQPAHGAAALSRTLAPAFNLRHKDRPLEPGTSAYERELARLDFRNRLLAANTVARTAGALLQLRNALFNLVAGYGHAPMRSIWTLLAMVAVMAGLSFATWNAGDFAPNSDVVLVSEGWTEIANAPDGLDINAAAIWSSATGPGRDYESFNALFYAVDVVLPLVEIGQEAAWAPSPARGWLGWFAHHAQKVFVILGWIVAAIFAGAVTGIIRRDD
ncbi:hypothetical protein [Stappia sp. P2PMeth1]|uniref:hypothetical protein n=1 Tax=Stappia sp. P2PMeth1 TaxID=2003586 RepID=UPI0016449718|nr:hypothetical protein [Stappia sp. P2PMeth1]